MEFRIWVETRLDGRIVERELVSSVERPASGIGPEEIGLKLDERQGHASKSAGSDRSDSGGCAESCSQAMLPVWPGSARQGSSNPVSPNGFWNRSSLLPTPFSLQVPRRQESGHLAPPSPSAFGDLTGTSVPTVALHSNRPP